MNKYAIYTEGDVYPVLEKDGQYYIGIPNTGHFSGDWKFLGVRERLKNSRTIIKPEEALKITDWKFKNGSPRYQVVDLDHGTVRTWAGTSPNQQLRSFDTISDSGFELATKTDNDEEIVLEESKKYAIYATYGGDGVYNSKLVDTVDSEEQAVDRVAELQATGVGASYEEIDNEEDNRISNIAGKVYDKYSEFVQGIYEDNKNLNEFVSNMREDEGFLDYLNDYYDITSEKDIDLICRELYNIQVDIMNSLQEECSQASGVASGVNGKIDSFPINPKEMENQRLKESINNPLMQKDFERMNKMNDVDSIKDYLYEITMSQNYDEAKNTLIEYLKQATLDKNQNIIEATKYIIDTSFGGLQGLEDFFTLTESKNDKNLDWIYDENEKLYHCEIDNWYFNIYELEDGTYNLIVDYDEDELQDLDDIFDTLEEAKKKAQEIYNKGISEYNGDDFAGFEYETESKDLTKTLQEMALLEDYEEDKPISPQKQKFIDYCKDKIEDLGDVEIYDEDYEENIQYHKLMHTEGIREFNDLYIIANFDDYENENLIAINNENKIVINTPMIDCNGYAGTMQFDKIDKKFYDQLMDYWDDIYMDEMIEEE